MPILNIQLSGGLETPDGQRVALPSQAVLLQRGPVIQVTVGVGQAIAQQVLQQGGQLPPPVTGLALIDTGATTTCIDEEAAQKLQLPAIDVVTVASVSHASTERNVYPISIEVAGLPIVVNAPRSVGAELKAQGLLLLIGRDVLQSCVLVYNGPAGQFTLTL